MSWIEIFPIFDDDMLELYQKEASEREKRAMADLFAVESIHNEKKVGHVVATSLFWKPACLGEADFPTPSKAVMENPGKHGLSSRFKNPWEHYVEPVFEATRHLAIIRPDLVYRVYLANDLSFLIPELVAAGCEVYLMKSSSLLHNPGGDVAFSRDGGRGPRHDERLGPGRRDDSRYRAHRAGRGRGARFLALPLQMGHQRVRTLSDNVKWGVPLALRAQQCQRHLPARLRQSGESQIRKGKRGQSYRIDIVPDLLR